MTNNITILETIFKLVGLREYTTDRIRKNGNRAWQDSTGRIYTSHANGYIRVREMKHQYYWDTAGKYSPVSYQMNPVRNGFRVLIGEESNRMLRILRRHLGRVHREEVDVRG